MRRSAAALLVLAIAAAGCSGKDPPDADDGLVAAPLGADGLPLPTMPNGTANGTAWPTSDTLSSRRARTSTRPASTT